MSSPTDRDARGFDFAAHSGSDAMNTGMALTKANAGVRHAWA